MANKNETIAKNIVFLYFRMLLTIIVGLYTSRVILNTLGVTDYGVYNVVGGIVNMVAFLNVGMMGASQRFFNYYMGKKRSNDLKRVFCTSVITHMLIGILILIISELIGLYILNYKLNIPEGRMYAANWVLQCSIFTFCVSVFTVPFNSCVIAHEHMNVYAYVSIIEVLLKLIIVYILLMSNFDHLILYSILIFFVSILVSSIYVIYCRIKFEESHFKCLFDKKLLREMFSFAGWGMVGNMGFTLKDQGSNIILNLFLGTTVNAARGIATQVSNIINSFAGNFIMAINPQITKSYANGDNSRSRVLVYSGSKMAFYLLTIIIIPFLMNCEYILELWLGIVPEYTKLFLYFILSGALLYSLAGPVATGIMATGRVKCFQIGLALILLSELPLSYMILYLGGTPNQAMIPYPISMLCSVIWRIYLLNRYVDGYSVTYYLLNNVLRCAIVFAMCYFMSLYFCNFFHKSFISLIITSVLSIIVTVVIILVFGLNYKEKSFVVSRIKSIIDGKFY